MIHFKFLDFLVHYYIWITPFSHLQQKKLFIETFFDLEFRKGDLDFFWNSFEMVEHFGRSREFFRVIFRIFFREEMAGHDKQNGPNYIERIENEITSLVKIKNIVTKGSKNIFLGKIHFFPSNWNNSICSPIFQLKFAAQFSKRSSIFSHFSSINPFSSNHHIIKLWFVVIAL